MDIVTTSNTDGGQMVADEWRPANEVERAMVAALKRGADQQYAELLMSAPLYLPVLRDRGADWLRKLGDIVPLNSDHMLVFTSPEAMASVLGDVATEWRRTDLAALKELAPGDDYLLAVNAGLPISALLPMKAVAALAEGTEALVALEDVQDTITVEVLNLIRNACLGELSDTGGSDVHTSELRETAPVNGLETELQGAINNGDGSAFVEALVGAEVVVPTSSSVSDSGQTQEDESIPWLTVGNAASLAIPVFSSTAALTGATSATIPSVTAPFLALLANWPSEKHTLCFNPGISTELILPGADVLELASAIQEATDDELDADGDEPSSDTS